eukprot:366555-Chlamydomonas_euryale.AAC.7
MPRSRATRGTSNTSAPSEETSLAADATDGAGAPWCMSLLLPPVTPASPAREAAAALRVT